MSLQKQDMGGMSLQWQSCINVSLPRISQICPNEQHLYTSSNLLNYKKSVFSNQIQINTMLENMSAQTADGCEIKVVTLEL